MPTVTLCGFTIAGGFSASISTSIGNEVLIDPTNCAVVLDLGSSVSLCWHPQPRKPLF